MANESLSAAKAAKNDEFYTQYYDIEREINAYLEFDPDVFRGKLSCCPVMTRNGATLPSISHSTFRHWA